MYFWMLFNMKFSRLLLKANKLTAQRGAWFAFMCMWAASAQASDLPTDADVPTLILGLACITAFGFGFNAGRQP